jgi:hypothetical protein
MRPYATSVEGLKLLVYEAWKFDLEMRSRDALKTRCKNTRSTCAKTGALAAKTGVFEALTSFASDYTQAAGVRLRPHELVA